MTLPETRRKEINVLVRDVNVLNRELAAKGITQIDDEDRMEAMNIINRIERRMLANMPMSINSTTSEVEKIDTPAPSTPTHEAAE